MAITVCVFRLHHVYTVYTVIIIIIIIIVIIIIIIKHFYRYCDWLCAEKIERHTSIIIPYQYPPPPPLNKVVSFRAKYSDVSTQHAITYLLHEVLFRVCFGYGVIIVSVLC